MNREYVDSNIYIIKNVFSDEHFKILQNFAEEDSEWEGQKNTLVSYNENESNETTVLKKNFTEEISIFYKAIFKNVLDTFEPELYIKRDDSIKKYPAGLESPKGSGWAMAPHADCDPKHHLTKNIKKGIVFYLNSNYNGGEIEYVNKGISLKPEENSIIVHPSTEEYKHGVRVVTNGNRYIYTNFLRKF